ncbi:MAG: hypothetical protein LBS03_06265 [Bacteroidales bacterium]|jgi:trigger factor|nr:hypothetical protein [Bacteroidales bacterium]
MNIIKQQVDNLNLIISLEINSADYTQNVEKTLREYKQKSNMHGFRPGKVPDGLIRKLYSKSVLADEINRLVINSIAQYVEDEKLSILGDPMPTFNIEDINWEIGNNFHFDFEIGLSPDIDLNLSDNDKIIKYKITVDKKLVNENIDLILSQYGYFETFDAVNDFSEKLTGNILQLDNDKQPSENGLEADDTNILLSLISDDKYKKPFENAKVNDEIIFNLSETFSDTEILRILKKKHIDETNDLKDVFFRFTVTGIDKLVKAEPDQELFDSLYGEETVHTQEEFESRVESEIADNFEEAAMNKFSTDVQKYLVEKIAPPLPDRFLRKWLWDTHKGKMDETEFDRQFPAFLKDIQWSVISTAVAKQFDLKVEGQEVIGYAMQLVKSQLAAYGLIHLPEEELVDYALNYLKDEKNKRQIIHTLLDGKVIRTVIDAVHPEIKEVSREEYNEIIQPKSE